MRREARPGWAITVLHWEQEELVVEYRRGVGAERARTLVADMFASGRVPPLPRDERSGCVVSAIPSRLWWGAQVCPDGDYVVVIIESHCMVAQVHHAPSCGEGRETP